MNIQDVLNPATDISLNNIPTSLLEPLESSYLPKALELGFKTDTPAKMLSLDELKSKVRKLGAFCGFEVYAAIRNTNYRCWKCKSWDACTFKVEF
jgi:hypothetical protein